MTGVFIRAAACEWNRKMDPRLMTTDTFEFNALDKASEVMDRNSTA